MTCLRYIRVPSQLLLISVSMYPYAMESSAQDLVSKLRQASSHQREVQPPERIYLHLDRKIFMSGDIVWFSAYDQSGISDRLTVELVSHTGKHLVNENVYLNEGYGTGYINLPDTLATSYYYVVAYSDYSLRSDSSYFLDRIAIFNIDAKEQRSTDKPHSTSPIRSITFHPEGGSLVSGIESVVAFVAMEGNQPWTNLAGKVVDDNGNLITEFKESQPGMGTFVFTPDPGRKYFASVQNIQDVFPIPPAVSEGYTLHVVNKENEKNAQLTVRTNRLLPNNNILIIAHSASTILYDVSVNIASGHVNGIIPKKVLRPGINTLSVFEPSGHLVAERSIFLPYTDEPQARITLEKSSVGKRSKVKAIITITNAKGEPVPAVLSTSVTDESQAPVDPENGTISTYFNFSSQFLVQSSVPVSYFDKEGRPNHAGIDELLLFYPRKKLLWEQLKLPIPIQPERGFTLRGRLVEEFNNKPVDRGQVIYVSSDSLATYGVANTDSIGRFSIDSIYAIGNTTFFLQGKYKKKEKYGQIQLDTIREPFTPKIPLHDSLSSLGDLQRKIIQVGVNRRLADLSYDRHDDNTQLREVVIQGKREEEQIRKGAPRVDGNTLVIEPKENNGANHPAELLRNVPGFKVVSTSTGGYRIFRRGKMLNVYWDGFWFPDPSILDAYSASQVGRIEVHGSAVYMWSKLMGGRAVDIKKSTRYTLRGFQNPKSFSAPTYDVQLPVHVKPDYRATLHWAPNLVTDSLGQVVVEFYTSDLETEINIQVEGLTLEGAPFAARRRFTVRSID